MVVADDVTAAHCVAVESLASGRRHSEVFPSSGYSIAVRLIPYRHNAGPRHTYCSAAMSGSCKECS